MARRAARRALKPHVAQALEGLGFTREWPVFITWRQLYWEDTSGHHPIGDGLGITLSRPRAVTAWGVHKMEQWPCSTFQFDLDEIHLVREPGFLLDPVPDVHAFVLDGRIVQQGCSVRVLLSDDSVGGVSPSLRAVAPIYTQVECGEPESDAAQFWSYSLKDV